MSRRQQRTDEFGFSLIELMVVVLVIGVLVAIAVPKFFGAQRAAKGRTAQANVRSAEAIMSTIFAEKTAFEPINLALLTREDASLFPASDTVATPSTRPGFISWAYAHSGVANSDPTSADGFVMAARSVDGRCYLMMVGATGRLFGQLPAPAAGDCVATAVPLPSPSASQPWGPDEGVQWG